VAAAEAPLRVVWREERRSRQIGDDQATAVAQRLGRRRELALERGSGETCVACFSLADVLGGYGDLVLSGLDEESARGDADRFGRDLREGGEGSA